MEDNCWWAWKLIWDSVLAQLQLAQAQFQAVEVSEVDEADMLVASFLVVDSLADQDQQLATSAEDQTISLAIARLKQWNATPVASLVTSQGIALHQTGDHSTLLARPATSVVKLDSKCFCGKMFELRWLLFSISRDCPTKATNGDLAGGDAELGAPVAAVAPVA
jgi:hypothetical protein